ncbi:unnamed protein product [Rotaria magnacalcarata]|uniref:Reverse transcriptase domain-containing protein n=1 Tax=Rotaria magnacalcarata TaxID=392030 RepID=A0A820AAN0_9BILA|nr:unnamed protein product [Rotaria magnacalcarata]
MTLLIFEQRILCHTLTKTFNDIPIVKYQNFFGNEANKIMQELKRRKLNDQLKNYELEFQHYEDLYKTEINIFESKLIYISLNHQHIQADILMTLLKCYLSYYTNRLIRQIRYKEACVHVKLVRQYCRHLLSKQQIVDVYPQIIVDVPKVSLNQIQLDYLSKSGKSGIFHIGNSVDYEKKAEAYRQKTGFYIELDSNPLWSVFDKVILLLNDLRSNKYILSWQLHKMMPEREKVQLDYLYFIPKPHKTGTPLKPIVSSMNMSTTGISKFLDKIIRPIFDKHARSITIIDGVSLIQRLEAYTTNGYLKPKTYLYTFDITDLYTILPKEESLDILVEFLLQHGYEKVQNIPIDIIRKLALIVSKENVFVYEKKFYRQVIGDAMGSAFTITLANIFMWEWQMQVVH